MPTTQQLYSSMFWHTSLSSDSGCRGGGCRGGPCPSSSPLESAGAVASGSKVTVKHHRASLVGEARTPSICDSGTSIS